MKKIDTEGYTELCVWGAAFSSAFVIKENITWGVDKSVFLFEWDRGWQVDISSECWTGFRLARKA